MSDNIPLRNGEGLRAAGNAEGKISAARRATILLLILAILVSPAASVMPMAATMPAMAMTGPDDGDCKGCLPGKMTIADCGTVCLSLPAVIAPAAAFLPPVEHSPWLWDDDQVGRYPTKPPTAPPRSDG